MDQLTKQRVASLDVSLPPKAMLAQVRALAMMTAAGAGGDLINLFS